VEWWDSVNGRETRPAFAGLGVCSQCARTLFVIGQAVLLPLPTYSRTCVSFLPFLPCAQCSKRCFYVCQWLALPQPFAIVALDFQFITGGSFPHYLPFLADQPSTIRLKLHRRRQGAGFKIRIRCVCSIIDCTISKTIPRYCL
jgi:hypothetical protein